MLVSDIRTANGKEMEQLETQDFVLRDNQLQAGWVTKIDPLAAHLKFRCPYPDRMTGLTQFKYLDGECWFQPWLAPTSTELRLVINNMNNTNNGNSTNTNDSSNSNSNSNSNGSGVKYKNYDVVKIEENCFWLNYVARQSIIKHDYYYPNIGIIESWDCWLECMILENYLHTMFNITKEEMQTHSLVEKLVDRITRELSPKPGQKTLLSYHQPRRMGLNQINHKNFWDNLDKQNKTNNNNKRNSNSNTNGNNNTNKNKEKEKENGNQNNIENKNEEQDDGELFDEPPRKRIKLSGQTWKGKHYNSCQFDPSMVTGNSLNIPFLSAIRTSDNRFNKIIDAIWDNIGFVHVNIVNNNQNSANQNINTNNIDNNANVNKIQMLSNILCDYTSNNTNNWINNFNNNKKNNNKNKNDSTNKSNDQDVELKTNQTETNSKVDVVDNIKSELENWRVCYHTDVLTKHYSLLVSLGNYNSNNNHNNHSNNNNNSGKDKEDTKSEEGEEGEEGEEQDIDVLCGIEGVYFVTRAQFQTQDAMTIHEVNRENIAQMQKILTPNTIIIGKFAQSQDILNSQSEQNHDVNETQFVCYDTLCNDGSCDLIKLGSDIVERCHNHLKKMANALNESDFCARWRNNDNKANNNSDNKKTTMDFSFDCINYHSIKAIPHLLSGIQKFDGSGIYDKQRPPQWQQSCHFAETNLFEDERAVRGGIKYVSKNIGGNSARGNCNDSKNSDNTKKNDENDEIGVDDNDDDYKYHRDRRTKGLLLIHCKTNGNSDGNLIANTSTTNVLTPLNTVWGTNLRGARLCFAKVMSNFSPEPMLLDISPIKENAQQNEIYMQNSYNSRNRNNKKNININQNKNGLQCKLFHLFDTKHQIGITKLKSAEIGLIENDFLMNNENKEFIMVDGCWRNYNCYGSSNGGDSMPCYWVDFILERQRVPKDIYSHRENKVCYEQNLIDFVNHVYGNTQ